MKKVLNPSDVAHYFANKVQSEGRTSSSNFYFNTDYKGNISIFSYGSHFCIARHVENLQGQKAVTFTNRRYSNTTATQIATVRQACNHIDKIYCYDPSSSTAENLEQWLKNVNSIIGAINSAKQQRSKLKAFEQLESVKSEVNIYCEFWGLNLETENKELFIALQSNDFTDLLKFKEQQDEIQKEKRALMAIKALKEHKENLKKWRKFDGRYNRLYTRIEQVDYLRFNTSTNRVETSQGIEIPLRTAKDFYSKVLETVKTGKCTICGSDFMDKYEVKEISKDHVIVGCHNITIKEIQKLAKALNW